MNHMPESTPVIDALNSGAALQVDRANVNILELPQELDSLKSIIARLIQASSIQELKCSKRLDQIELRLRSEQQIMMAAHQVEQKRMLATHMGEHAKLKAELVLPIQQIY